MHSGDSRRGLWTLVLGLWAWGFGFPLSAFRFREVPGGILPGPSSVDFSEPPGMDGDPGPRRNPERTRVRLPVGRSCRPRPASPLAGRDAAMPVESWACGEAPSVRRRCGGLVSGHRGRPRRRDRVSASRDRCLPPHSVGEHAFLWATCSKGRGSRCGPRCGPLHGGQPDSSDHPLPPRAGRRRRAPRLLRARRPAHETPSPGTGGGLAESGWILSGRTLEWREVLPPHGGLVLPHTPPP